MSRTILGYLGWVFPLVPAVAGAAALVELAGADPRSSQIAWALLAAGAVCAVLVQVGFARSVKRRTLQHCRKRYRADVESFFAGLGRLENEVTSLWAKQVETGRAQTEQAIVDLTIRFNAIVAKLDEAMAASSLSAESVDSANGLVTVFNRSESRLGEVKDSLGQAMGNKEILLNEVGALVRHIEQLKDMAASVASIADQTNLLALNAAIEAARAGEAGRGFSVVAVEVRKLSSLSGETGRRISETVNVISAAINDAFSAAEGYAAKEAALEEHAGAVIHEVLDELRQVMNGLSESGEVLRRTSLGIKDDVSESIMQFQFQDRVSQILAHVRDNINAFPAYLAAGEERFHEQGRLVAIDWTGLLEELERSYATQEELANHARSPSAPALAAPKDDITFF